MVINNMSKLEENQQKIYELEQVILQLDNETAEFKAKTKELLKLKEETYSNLTPWDRVLIARGQSRFSKYPSQIRATSRPLMFLRGARQ